jgi:hypothetical protein
MTEKYFFYRQNGELKKININDIILFESVKNYVHFLTAYENIIVRITFVNALKLLSPYNFIKVNRAKAISLRYLVSVNNNEVIIKFQPINKLYKKLQLQLKKQREVELSKLEAVDTAEEPSKIPSLEDLEKIIKEIDLPLELAKTCYKPLLQRLTILENPKDYVEEMEISESDTERI